MHKKLEAELVSLAHTILQMKNRNDAVALKEKARDLYERLSVLTFVDEYLNTTPNADETKEELIAKIEKAKDKKPIEIVKELLQVSGVEEKIEVKETDKIETEEIEIEEKIIEETVEIEAEIELEIPVVKTKKTLTIDEEFKDSVSVDVTTNLFTKIEKKELEIKPSLNDILQTNIQVGLNDRIAFVKHLFNHSQSDFNRVLSQLNSFKTEKEAMTFINEMVKPDYDWAGKEEFEERFLTLVERKFL